MAGFLKKLLNFGQSHPEIPVKVVLEPQIKVTISNPSSFGSPAFTPEQMRASELASQAVQLKDIQLSKSIELLREAFKLWPDNTEISFRLARYLRQDGHRDEAFSIYQQLTTSVDPRNFVAFGHSHSAILAEMMKQLYEEKQFNYYLYYHLFELWNNLIGLATQGVYPDIAEDFFETYGPQTKITKALKSLDIYSQRPRLTSGIFNSIQSFDSKFRRMSVLSKENQFPSLEAIPSQGLSSGERQNAALLKNEEFVKIFADLSCPTLPDKIWKDIFTPMLKQSDEIKI